VLELRGSLAGREIRVPLRPGRHRLGRAPLNDIVLDDRSVSREHAEIAVEPPGATIHDLGSKNGTWLNDAHVSGPVPLGRGDRLRVGSVHLMVAAEGGETTFGRTLFADALSGPAAVAADLSVVAASRVSLDQVSVSPASLPEGDRLLMNALTKVGQFLVLPRPLNETCDQLLALVEQLVPARRYLLLLSRDDGQDFTVFASRPAQAASASNLILSRTLLGTVLTGREALVLNDAPTDARFGGHESIVASRLRSAMVAPLVDSDQVIGLLYADSDDPAARYDTEKLRLFSFLANLIAVKIANARLLELKAEKDRMAREAAAAAQVQRHLLPTARPEVPGYDILARQIPCYEVGGDLHDTAVLDDGRVVVVVGDVTGKGMGAALLMSNTLAALRVLYAEDGALEAVVERVHRELLQASDDMHFVTLFIGVLDPRLHRLTYVNAGHNPPILLGNDAAPRRLTPTGLPLGLIPGAVYRSAEVDLPPAALLCIHTDGIPEAALGEDFYEDERLIATLDRTRAEPVEAIAEAIVGDLRAFLGEAPLDDDVTFLLLRRDGAA